MIVSAFTDETTRARIAYRRARDIYYAASARADEAFNRYFQKMQNGEPTNGAAYSRLSNLASYASTDLWDAQHELFSLGIDPHELDKQDGVPETPL